jgi:putative nucleotidyltransferase with HDIG domain
VYRGVRRIDTVKDAVARLGISEVARLAAAISMKSVYSEDVTRSHERFRALWTQLFLHAVVVARCASELARQKLAATSGTEQTFMAGLLHDVGLASTLRATAELSIFGKLPELEPAVLRRVLYRLHVEAGAELHKSWRLPPSLAEVAAHHHEPTAAGEPAPLVHLVRLVSALDLLRRAPGMHPRAPAEVVESARALHVPPGRVATMPADLDAAESWVSTVFPA